MEEMIKAALPKLDATKDSDWTENGAPSLKRMRQLIKNDALTQAQLDQFTSGVKRPKFERDPSLPTRTEPDVEAIKEARSNHVIDEVMVATERGYAAGAIREPGDAFLFSGVKGSWMREEEPDETKARLKAIRDAA